MKRFTFGAEPSDQMDNVDNMAGVLMLLSQSTTNQNGPAHSAHSSSTRLFECKTCNRRFPSFQALGGHRASHKKPRIVNGPGQGKPRVHECPVCGLAFPVGQALGGHMRRHRAEGGGHVHAHGHAHGVGEKKREWLDLNLPPVEDEIDCRKKIGFEIESLDKIPMVDCFH